MSEEFVDKARSLYLSSIMNFFFAAFNSISMKIKKF